MRDTVTTGLRAPNDLVRGPDERIWFTDPGSPHEERPGQVLPGGPDGLAFDEEGRLHVAIPESDQIAVLGPSGTPGVPIPGVKMKLVNDDWSEVSDDEDAVREIAIKGHNVFKGYLGRPEATAEVLSDGWFRSGDLARKDADGYYYLVDRAKDVIIRGGYNVYPRELEEVLITHPGVSYVAVIGVPSESHGEEIKAVVVKRPGVHLTEAELRAWGKAQFASYKYPRIIEFRAALPMTSTGKILKRAIR